MPPAPLETSPSSKSTERLVAPLPLSQQSLRTADSPISYFIRKAIETKGLISLAAGLVDESNFPTQAIADAVNKLMSDPAKAKATLQYGSTQGLPGLRQKVLEHVCEADGVRPSELNLSVEDVILTTGSQQMLYLLGEALFNEGDIVITEAPSYFVFHSALQSHGARVLTVPMDDDGMDLDCLEKLLVQLERSGELNRLKLIYTVDYFQNPTGLSLSRERRPRLLELAKRFSTQHRILILEDAAYRELRYSGDDVVSIKRFDEKNEYVIYTSTFSKPCAPGFKTGYSIVPADLVGPLCNLKGNHDFGSTNFSQFILLELMENGSYSRHVKTLRTVYRDKRDAMLRAIESEFGDWPEVRWTEPAGGLYVWLTFPEHINAGPSGELIERALQEGVLYVPGEFGHAGDQDSIPSNEVRLSFGVSEPKEIEEGIRRLRRACRGMEQKHDAASAGLITV